MDINENIKNERNHRKNNGVYLQNYSYLSFHLSQT